MKLQPSVHFMLAAIVLSGSCRVSAGPLRHLRKGPIKKRVRSTRRRLGG